MIKFGLKGIFKDYSVGEFGKDLILPFLVACILTPIMLMSNKSPYHCLMEILNFGIIVVPILITLILTAYVLLLSMFGSTLKDFCTYESGVDLHKKLNSGFAANLIISILSLVGIFIGTFIAKMEFYSDYANSVNQIAYAIYVILVAYPIFSLFGITIDLFNVGQVTRIK
ncbi:MAG: hypothetical protein HDR88_14485 [Bacteroides sp.]|nr:hypothetical protein [Bacteroides sp.]